MSLKYTQLTDDPVPTDADLISMIIDVGGTPLSRKITRANFLGAADITLLAGINLNMADNTDIRWSGSADRKIKNTTGGFEFEVETGDTFQFTIQDANEMTLTNTALTLASANDLVLVGTGQVLWAAGESIGMESNDMIFDVTTGDFFSWDIAGTPEYSFDATEADWKGNDLINVGTIFFAAGESISMQSNDMFFDVTASDIFSWDIAGTPEMTLSATALDILGNDLDNIQNLIHDLSTSGTDVDFGEDELQEISISANTTFTGTGYAIGKSKTVKITTDGTLRTLTFPSGWVFVGGAAPADQAASKTGILTLTSFTAAEAGVVVAYAVQS